MNPSPSNWLLSLMLLFVASEAGILVHKVDLLIYNDLQNGTFLTIHCKSKQDDLGVHLLAYRDYFEVKFRPNMFGTTLFYCSMQWDATRHWFDIYTSERDTCTYCSWNVRPDGPCLMESDKSKNSTTCYHWN
ncbi:hypothetical protein Gogos_009090 [Gossypium gossypioides]|uniref:S-protein homolog n=1 Tax=Gossypium gossypioides TaxID=34282 RepID=A0A7J9CE59_GOSGO|nr:hypothetical protein [Gossypium gossypioides]